MPRRDQAWLNAYEAKHRGKNFPTCLTQSAGVEREADLQEEIEEYCRGRQWICLRSRMDKPTTRMRGEPDLTILAPGGIVLWIECKRKNEKPTTEQLGFHAWAERLGHKVYVVRNMDGFFAAMMERGVK